MTKNWIYLWVNQKVYFNDSWKMPIIVYSICSLKNWGCNSVVRVSFWWLQSLETEVQWTAVKLSFFGRWFESNLPHEKRIDYPLNDWDKGSIPFILWMSSNGKTTHRQITTSLCCPWIRLQGFFISSKGLNKGINLT